MKKNSKNKKGMTLVEDIIAMALLSGMSAMLVTVAVAAKRQNLENYYRNNEMYTQAVNAEQYNDNKTVNMNELKVNKFSSSGKTTNEFALEADFGSGIKFNTTAYGFKAKLNNIDEDAGYQLKFLQGKDINITPNPEKSVYWVKFYNNSIGDGGNQQFGVVLSGVTGSDYFGFSQSSDLYSSAPTADAAAFKITDATFDHYLEKDASGKATGYVVIHYMGGSDYKNQAEYDDAQSTP